MPRDAQARRPRARPPLRDARADAARREPPLTFSFSVSVLVCTYGDDAWRRLAVAAGRSALRQGQGAPSSIRRVEVLGRHDPDGTLAGVRNRAASEATGDWLCFLDADDELAPGYLVAMMRAVLREDVDDDRLLLVPAVQFVRDGEAEPPVVLNTGRPLFEVNRAVIGTLVPRDLFMEVGGFRDDLDALEDWELWLRCERAGAPLVDVPDAVYRARLRPGSRNRDQSAYRRIRAEYDLSLCRGPEGLT